MKPIRKSETLSSQVAAGKLDSLIDQLQSDSLPIIIRNASDKRAVLISMDDYDMFLESIDGLNRIEEELSQFSETALPDTSFSSRPGPASDDYAEIFQFKVTLQDVNPPVWRRIQVPTTYTYWDLHVAIQDAMGWEDTHLHTFEVDISEGKRLEISNIPKDEQDAEHQVLPDWEVSLADHISAGIAELRYIYDLGDYWVHLVQMEAILPRDGDKEYPICLDGQRACPPEDCGGPPGYSDLLEAVNDPEDEAHAYWNDWIGEGFDPDHFSTSEVFFDDPEDHWEDIFGNEVLDEEFDELDADDARLHLLRMTREHMTKTWQRVQNDDLEGLSAQDRRIARIMQEHRDVLFDEFSAAQMSSDDEIDPDTEVNPFLHITLHEIVEQQLEDRNPIEAFQFYNAMRKKNCSRHDAIHLVGLILTPLIFRVLKHGEPFDQPLYVRLLKKYRNRNPARIPGLVEKDPDWDF